MTRVYPLAAANGRQTAGKLSDFFAGRNKAKTLRMDNASHFKNRYVADLLEGAGIQPIWSAPYKPFTNGVAERCVGRAKEWITANEPVHWDTPASLWRLNAHLSLPPLITQKPTLQRGGMADPLGIGQKVWIARGRSNRGIGAIKHSNEGMDVITAIDGNLITCRDVGPVHRSQVVPWVM